MKKLTLPHTPKKTFTESLFFSIMLTKSVSKYAHTTPSASAKLF